jgi:hypothetical protein
MRIHPWGIYHPDLALLYEPGTLYPDRLQPPMDSGSEELDDESSKKRGCLLRVNPYSRKLLLYFSG